MTSFSNHIDIKKSPKSQRRNLFNLHSWVGFNLTFIMTLVLATGTFSTVSNEIDWLIQSDMRVKPAVKTVSWQVMTDAIHNYAPESALISIEEMKADYIAYRATLIDNYGSQYFVHVNQWTGEVTGSTGRLTVQRVLRDLHRYLFMPSIIGLPIVASMAFILLISLYTGLKTARNWMSLMTRIRFNKGFRVLFGDAHKAIGLWASWFILLMSVTGIWYLAELGSEVGARITGDKAVAFELDRPSLSTEQLRSFGVGMDTAKTEQIIQAAQIAFPELKISAIFYPTKPKQAISVLGYRNNPILRSRANRVFLDPVTLIPLSVQRSEDINTVAWLNEIADPLHFGFFGGLITKLIWFVFGLALTSLSISGVYLVWKRLGVATLSRSQMTTLPILVITGLFAVLYWYPVYKTPAKPHDEHMLSFEPEDAFLYQLYLSKNTENQFDGGLRLLVSGMNEGSDTRVKKVMPNIKEVKLTLNKDDVPLGKSKKLKLKKFSVVSLFKSGVSAELLREASAIQLDIEFNDGELVSTVWPID